MGREYGVIYESGGRGCLLWEKARTLARDRGLIMRKGCSVEEVCEGSYCPFISKYDEVEEGRIEGFYRRVEEHAESFEEKRLRELRAELQEQINKTQANEAYERGMSDGLAEK